MFFKDWLFIFVTCSQCRSDFGLREKGGNVLCEGRVAVGLGECIALMGFGLECGGTWEGGVSPSCKSTHHR